MMRYIWNHDALARTLDQASAFGPIIKTAFFFYHRGSFLQKCLEGMLYSILKRILEQKSRFASVLLPDFTGLEKGQRAKWNLARFLKAKNDILAQETSFPVKRFLFIEDLDKYDGRPEVIVQFIQSSAKKSSGKRNLSKSVLLQQTVDGL